MPALPAEVAALRAELDSALGTHVQQITGRLPRLHPALELLGEELRAFVAAGGKRLRPLFLVVGYQAAGGRDPGAVLGPALALELVHTCALVHDDLVDGAATRRGRPAAHVAFAERYRADGWRADAAEFGRAAALLLGDLAFVVADELFIQSTGEVAVDRLLTAFRTFTTMREELTAGQYLDVVAAHRRDPSPDLALAVAGYKSARYSVARPLEIGAILAAGQGTVSRGLVQVGVPLGQAFQLRDDVLGVFGAEERTGKSTLSDLAEGKRTLLVALTAERLDAAGRARLERLLGRRDLSVAEADEIRALMRASGGLAATEARADALVQEAMRALDELPVSADARQLLRELAGYLVARTV
ncbi:MAG TPA: polyprenyl synthetase family protein [Nitriliruptorales bacterium]|nr:polyprenyl synthetase family protein [Nitriliruptorales bacterium]